MSGKSWEPPTEFPREEIVRISHDVLARPDIPIRVVEDIFRIRVVEMNWDIGGKVYQPEEDGRVPLDADGRKAGIFLIHGGGGDHRTTEPMAMLLATKFGFKVATMTYPGHLYLLDPSRNWPGDTINPDGTARTPIWDTDNLITADQYELVQDREDPKLRAKYGTLFFLRAKEGTEFYYRLAAWPVAFEEAMKEVCRRNFPVDEYSVYVHGHSTGGPFAHMLLQRVENIAGLVGMESSPFGQIFSKMLDQTWKFPFNYMTVRSWRDVARYAGPESGVEGIRRLPWLMEEVFAEWERKKHLPGIKAQHIIQFNAQEALAEAARVTARRLGLSAKESEELVRRYQGYTRPLSGPGVRPVPPLLYGIASGSRDHRPERYRNILLPALAAIDPPPRVRLVLFHGGVHSYMAAERDLPKGLGPAVASMWHDAIVHGYYLA